LLLACLSLAPAACMLLPCLPAARANRRLLLGVLRFCAWCTRSGRAESGRKRKETAWHRGERRRRRMVWWRRPNWGLVVRTGQILACLSLVCTGKTIRSVGGNLL
jgi:hypothetical protein